LIMIAIRQSHGANKQKVISIVWQGTYDEGRKGRQGKGVGHAAEVCPWAFIVWNLVLGSGFRDSATPGDGPRHCPETVACNARDIPEPRDLGVRPPVSAR
jgi:hypothetical protein